MERVGLRFGGGGGGRGKRVIHASGRGHGHGEGWGRGWGEEGAADRGSKLRYKGGQGEDRVGWG